MKLIDDLRRENLRALREEFGGLNRLSEMLEREDSQVSQWILGSKNSGTGKPRGMRGDTARFIETRCSKPQGWLDQDHGIAPALPAAPLYTDGSKQPPAPVNQAQIAIDIESSLHCLRMAALRIDDADRDALAGYVSKLIRDPERADLVPRALHILSPPAHKAMPETGAAKRAA